MDDNEESGLEKASPGVPSQEVQKRMITKVAEITSVARETLKKSEEAAAKYGRLLALTRDAKMQAESIQEMARNLIETAATVAKMAVEVCSYKNPSDLFEKNAAAFKDIDLEGFMHICNAKEDYPPTFEDESQPISDEPKASYIVLDTNAVMENLNFIQQLKEKVLSDGKQLFLPWKLLQELDVLKMRVKNSNQFEQEKRLKARKAVRAINSWIENGDPAVVGQNPLDKSLNRNYDFETNADDQFLRCCLNLEEIHKGQIKFLSLDKNLRTKAAVVGISLYKDGLPAEEEEEEGAQPQQQIPPPPPPPPPSHQLPSRIPRPSPPQPPSGSSSPPAKTRKLI